MEHQGQLQYCRKCSAFLAPIPRQYSRSKLKAVAIQRIVACALPYRVEHNNCGQNGIFVTEIPFQKAGLLVNGDSVSLESHFIVNLHFVEQPIRITLEYFR